MELSTRLRLRAAPGGFATMVLRNRAGIQRTLKRFIIAKSAATALGEHEFREMHGGADSNDCAMG